MPRQVDYYFSFQSPWAYIGHGPFREVVSTYDLKVNLKSVLLVDLFSQTGGMPLGKEQTLKPDEVYALTAFLLYKNGVITEDTVMDAESLPKVARLIWQS